MLNSVEVAGRDERNIEVCPKLLEWEWAIITFSKIHLQLSRHLEVLNLDPLHNSIEFYEQQDLLVHDTDPASFDWRGYFRQAFRDDRDILSLSCNLL